MSTTQKTTTPPQHVRERPILRRKIWDRIYKEDKNYMAIICGETGSGKSEFGLRLCEIIDSDFNEDRVAFTIQEFLELVNERHPPGSAILFDEVGIALSHAKHYEDDVIRVNHVLQSWREQNRVLIMTAPHINLIHKPDRGLLHAQMDMQKINRKYWLSKARYRNIKQDTDTGDILKPYPRLRDKSTGQTRRFRFLHLYKPSPELVEPYLEKKIEFNNRLNKEVLDQVTPDEHEDRTPKDVAEMLKEDGIEDFVSVHNGNKMRYLDWQLIKSEFGLSNNEAKTVKKLIEKDDEVEL